MYDELVADGTIVPAQEVPPPTVPMDYSWARVTTSTDSSTQCSCTFLPSFYTAALSPRTFVLFESSRVYNAVINTVDKAGAVLDQTPQLVSTDPRINGEKKCQVKYKHNSPTVSEPFYLFCVVIVIIINIVICLRNDE